MPLTPSAFAPYGSVIQSYPDERSAPKEIKIKTVNFGTARKFNHLAPVVALPPPEGVPQGEVNLCVFRSEPQNGDGRDEVTGKAQWEVKVLERHEFSSQSFVPMGGKEDGRYLVLVALPGPGASPLAFSLWSETDTVPHTPVTSRPPAPQTASPPSRPSAPSWPRPLTKAFRTTRACGTTR